MRCAASPAAGEPAPAAAGASATPAAASDADVSAASAADADAESLAAAAASSAHALAPPPDFDDTEYSKSFAVQEVAGLQLTLMPGLGGPPGGERERLALQLMLNIDRSASTVLVLSDDRKRPSLSAVVQPGQQGRMVRLAGSHRPLEALPLTLTGEATVGWGRLAGAGAGVKAVGGDFTAALALKGGLEGAASGELAYHQAVVETPALALSLGGALEAALARPLLPLPRPVALAPSLFGILSTRSRSASLLARWARAADGSGDALTLTAHRHAGKALEVGAKLAVNLATLESTVGVGARMQLGNDAYIGGPPLTLTASANNELKVAMSLQHFYISPFAPGTQMVSSLHGTFDHRAREHTVGVQLQFAY